MPQLIQKLIVREERRVLLIEDEPDISQIVIRWLRQHGMAVTHTGDGPRAATLCEQGNWDLILSDIELGGYNGLDLVDLSKKTHPLRPVIIMTGHERSEYAIRAVRGGVDDYLLKPLDRAALLGAVDRQFARADSQRASVLAIGAHPDDVEIGTGGLLLRHRAKGDRVHILTLTGGEQGGAPGLRHQESETAAKLIGATLYRASLPDTAVSEGHETIRVIQSVIEEVSPDIIYTHSLHDAHQDHRATHRATMVAARGISNIYCYLSPSGTIDFRPNHFAEIEAYLEAKLDVIDHYRTQTAKAPYLQREMTEATARYWGRFAGYRRVEPLEVIREAR